MLWVWYRVIMISVDVKSFWDITNINSEWFWQHLFLILPKTVLSLPALFSVVRVWREAQRAHMLTRWGRRRVKEGRKASVKLESRGWVSSGGGGRERNWELRRKALEQLWGPRLWYAVSRVFRNKRSALICSNCQVPWCEESHHGWLQATNAKSTS